MNRSKFIVAISVSLAMAFIVSCGLTGEVGSDSPEGGGSGSSSSSREQSDVELSSSSYGSSSSSSSIGTSNGRDHFNPNIIYDSFIDSRDNKTYFTVVIGTQTWMAENLNYNADGSKCFGEDGVVFDDEGEFTLSIAEVQANCAKYGRLYNWATAMNIDDSCNTQCIDDCGAIISSPYHQGICPNGWHLPSEDEWRTLFLYTFPENINLKAQSGWNDESNSTDVYGFSALPGGIVLWGYGYQILGYDNRLIGTVAEWWGATELIHSTGLYGRTRHSISFYLDLGWSSRNREHLLSVRCLKD